MNREIAEHNSSVEMPHPGMHDERDLTELTTKLDLNQELLVKAIADDDLEIAALIEKDSREIIEEIKGIKMKHVVSTEAMVHDKADELNKRQYLN